MRDYIWSATIFSTAYSLLFIGVMGADCYLVGDACYINETVPVSKWVIPMVVVFSVLALIGALAYLFLIFGVRVARLKGVVPILALGAASGTAPILFHSIYEYMASPPNVYPQIWDIEWAGLFSGTGAAALLVLCMRANKKLQPIANASVE